MTDQTYLWDAFISYAHDEEPGDGSGPAATLARALEAEGLKVWWDKALQVGDAWSPEIEAQARQSRHVVALMTPHARTRDWCKFEWTIGANAGTLLPVKLEACEPPEMIATEMARYQYIVAAEVDWVAAVVGKVAENRKSARAAAAPAMPVVWGELPGAPARLIGRDKELRELDRLWDEDYTVAALHALGGQGKSALAREWAERLLRSGQRAPKRVYAWSAQSQGSREGAQAVSTDGFLTEALKWFSDGAVSEALITAPAKERARELAKYLAKERCLLILDGLEPLQHSISVAPGAVENRGGRLKDGALVELLTSVASSSRSMILATSRQPFPELAPYKTGVWAQPLEKMSEEGGAELLTAQGVVGQPEQLRVAVRRLEGHALGIKLLGSYLAAVHGGAIERAEQFNLADLAETPDPEMVGDETAAAAARAGKIMRGYLEQFEKLAKSSKGQGAAELALLHMVGLFDRTADAGAVAALLAEPAIPGLTDAMFVRVDPATGEMQELSPAQRGQRIRFAKERLLKLGLLLEAPEEGALEAHPIVRAYFDRRLKTGDADAYQAAHLRLYEHYQKAAPDLPDNLDDMAPLRFAVGHGVKAGKAQEAFDEVYWRRMLQGSRKVLWRRLGGFADNLATLSSFFVAAPGAPAWETPSPELRPSSSAFAVGAAGFALRALGRLAEAQAPLAASERMDLAQSDFKNAAQDAENLSALSLTLGDVETARAAAARATEHADTSKDGNRRTGARTWRAAALQAAGRRDDALAVFVAAESIWASFGNVKCLWSLAGYKYADLLVELGRAEEALERAKELEQVYREQAMEDLLSRAVLALQFARAEAALAQATPPQQQSSWPWRRRKPSPERGERIARAAKRFDEAVERFEAAGQDDYTPYGLIERAAFLRWRFEETADAALLDKAEQDLLAAANIADRGGMRLHQTDIALERARLALSRHAEAPSAELVETARVNFRRADKLIQDTGYHRRDADLADLKSRLQAI